MAFTRTKLNYVITFCALVLVTLAVVWSLRGSPKPKMVGDFTTEGSQTTVITAGGCTVFVTVFKDQEPQQGRPKENYYFACPQR